MEWEQETEKEEKNSERRRQRNRNSDGWQALLSAESDMAVGDR